MIALLHPQVSSHKEQLTESEDGLELSANQHAATEESVKAEEKDKSRLARKCVELERKLVGLQRQLEGKNPEVIRTREEITHTEKRKAMATKSLEKIQATQKKAEKHVAQLESELLEITTEADSLEEKNAEAEAQHGELSLGKKQREDYNKLKDQVGSKTAALHEEMNSKKRALRGEEPALLQVRSKVDELKHEQHALEGKVAAFEERKQGSTERVKALSADVKQLQQQSQQTSNSSAANRGRLVDVEQELATVREALRASKATQRESERDRMSSEALDNLVRLFPGVHGRMLNICKPSQKRYNSAVTIAMGKNMDAIVVDEEKTAHECIKYLKEKKCAPETFVPLDTIRVKPIREQVKAPK